MMTCLIGHRLVWSPEPAVEVGVAERLGVACPTRAADRTSWARTSYTPAATTSSRATASANPLRPRAEPQVPMPQDSPAGRPVEDRHGFASSYRLTEPEIFAFVTGVKQFPDVGCTVRLP